MVDTHARRLLFAVIALVAIAALGGCKGEGKAGKWAENIGTVFNEYGKTGNADVLADMYTEDAVRIHPIAGEIRGKAGEKEFYEGLWKGFSDQRLVTTRQIVQGNKFSLEGNWEGKHRETGKSVSLLLIFNGEFRRPR